MSTFAIKKGERMDVPFLAAIVFSAILFFLLILCLVNLTNWGP